jgi:hypothetical protein
MIGRDFSEVNKLLSFSTHLLHKHHFITNLQAKRTAKNGFVLSEMIANFSDFGGKNGQCNKKLGRIYLYKIFAVF